jgi:hypothetical protein
MTASNLENKDGLESCITDEKPVMPFSTQECDDPPVRLIIILDIGRKKKDCRGFGVCEISIEIEARSNLNGNGVTGTATNEGGQLILKVMPEVVSLKAYNEYFSSGKFVVEDEYVMSPEVSKALGLKEGYVIKPGNYNVKQSKDYLTLSL